MRLFKRNQVDEAIGAVLNPNAAVAPRTLKTQVKRLLETDRALKDEEDKKRDGRGKYAFFHEMPPGSGTEIWFSEYESFALAVGLSLMVHQWPQSFVVAVLQEIRVDLEREHRRILSLDRKWLLDPAATAESIKKGQPPFNNRDPVLVTIVSNRALAKSKQSRPYACGVECGFENATTFASRVFPSLGAAWSFLDVTTSACLISDALARTQPRARGRS